MLLHIYFILFYILIYKSKSLAKYLVLLQIISLTGIYFTGYRYEILTLTDTFNLVYMIILLTLIILPWRKYNNIVKINVDNDAKLLKLTRFLLYVSSFSFIFLLLTSIIVFLTFNDINYFKYSEGVSTDFYYTLPYGARIFILAGYLSPLSYFLIPLHFYYLEKGKQRLAILCFIFSLNIFIYGLAHFSRLSIVQWSFMYFSFYILLNNTLRNKYKKNVKRVLIITGSVALLYIIYITKVRFAGDTTYFKLMHRSALIQDPILFSYVDYISQSYNNGMAVLQEYDFKLFNGQITFSPILSLLGHYNIVNFNGHDLLMLKRQLWPDHYYTFNGYTAYVVYDFGYLMALVITLLYNYTVKRVTPQNNKISMKYLFIIILLIQIPIYSIFYSSISGIIIPFFLLIPILFFLRNSKSRVR